MKLANEKTIELNMTYELMTVLGAGAIGFTQQGEFRTGADVFIPCADPFIIQFKVPRSGRDGHNARFDINNNSNRNQHRALDAISRSGRCEARYAFPLVMTDDYFLSNSGRLLPLTIFVDAHAITDSVSSRPADWFDRTHSVRVTYPGIFVVRSESEGHGKGVTGDKFLKNLKERTRISFEQKKAVEQERLDKWLVDATIRSLEEVVKEARVVGRTEHTLSYLAMGTQSRQLAYVSFPVQLRGWPRDRLPREG
jgi:hypothetical protein